MKSINYCLINTNHRAVSALSEIDPEFIAICRELLEKCLNENQPFEIPIPGLPKFKVSCNKKNQILQGTIFSPNAGTFNATDHFDNGTPLVHFMISLQPNDPHWFFLCSSIESNISQPEAPWCGVACLFSNLSLYGNNISWMDKFILSLCWAWAEIETIEV